MRGFDSNDGEREVPIQMIASARERSRKGGVTEEVSNRSRPLRIQTRNSKGETHFLKSSAALSPNPFFSVFTMWIGA